MASGGTARYERVAREAHAAALSADARRLAAQRRGAAAAARVAELRDSRLDPIHRPAEATARLAEAETTARLSRQLALEEYERSARAHEDAALAHERAADLLDSRGDSLLAETHREAATRERVGAEEDRSIGRAHATCGPKRRDA